MSAAESKALDVSEVAVAPLSGDDLALGVDLRRAPLLGVDGLVGGAAEVSLALESEGEHAAGGVLFARLLRVDETQFVSCNEKDVNRCRLKTFPRLRDSSPKPRGRVTQPTSTSTSSLSPHVHVGKGDIWVTAMTTASIRMWARAVIMQIRASNVSLRTRGASLNLGDVQKSTG